MRRRLGGAGKKKRSQATAPLCSSGSVKVLPSYSSSGRSVRQVARYTFSAAEEMGPKREQASAGARGQVLKCSLIVPYIANTLGHRLSAARGSWAGIGTAGRVVRRV